MEGGRSFPKLGLGTYMLRNKSYKMVLAALKAGYRHIDTAKLYGNESDVGQAIKDSGVPREEIFITTKIMRHDIKNRLKEAVESALNALDTYIDLLLLHVPTSNSVEAWSVLQDFKGDRVRELGVSNFSISDLEVLSPKPWCNQIELSPFLQRRPLVNYCKRNSIRIIAHSSLVKLDDYVIQEIGKMNRCTPAQVLLSWARIKGYHVIPRTSDKKHLIENMKFVALEYSDMYELDRLESGYTKFPKFI